MTSPEVIKFLSKIGRKGGSVTGQMNKARGSEYFKAIRAKRKLYPKYGPRKRHGKGKASVPLVRQDFA